ncbi:hypothetical protein J6590_064937 [Homalodisca vitripennis]|nr:hypothetical protein J6590_064937 [Homalodisca vitripennis]
METRSEKKGPKTATHPKSESSVPTVTGTMQESMYQRRNATSDNDISRTERACYRYKRSGSMRYRDQYSVEDSLEIQAKNVQSMSSPVPRSMYQRRNATSDNDISRTERACYRYKRSGSMRYRDQYSVEE